jgi:hypothetical protein
MMQLLTRNEIWYPGDSMNDWLHTLPIWQMGVVVFAMTYLVAGGIVIIITALAKGERARIFKQVSAGLLPPLGTASANL